MSPDERLVDERFPRSSAYHPEWVLSAVSGGANSLWLTEWLTGAMDLRPGMRVLDLGCGRGASSIFLHRELGVQVWAVDLWFDAAERLARVRDAGAADGVFPLHADARGLPFAAPFFDAVVSIDSYVYYGTDDLYLNYLARFVKPGGQIGIAGSGVIREMEGPVPAHLAEWWAAEQPYCLHSAGWWRQHWERTGILKIELADTLPDGWRFWRDWIKIIAPQNVAEMQAVESDAGAHLGYVRVAGHRRGEARLQDSLLSMPAQYMKKPLLRKGGV